MSQINMNTFSKLLFVAAVILFLQTVNINSQKPQSAKAVENTPVGQTKSDQLLATVAPAEGYTLNIKWGDLGKKLVESGAIDMAKYQQNYSKQSDKELLTYLTEYKEGGITINNKTSYFWVNTLWALGLVQNSQVLDEGIMGTQYKDRIGSFASTGGWTLGSKDAVTLYSSSNLIDLTQQEHELVHKIAQGIFRPCCGNPTSFPDCNHGMAILGLIEIMVDQGFSENEIYEAALAFNSYWFTQTYVDLAYYFETTQNLSWDEVDPKLVLSQQYSSAQGYQNVKEQIGTIPGSKQQGGSCGA